MRDETRRSRTHRVTLSLSGGGEFEVATKDEVLKKEEMKGTEGTEEMNVDISEAFP